MSKEIKKITVEVPHRISGFFEIVDEINGIKIKDPERIGSRGAGFCVNAEGKTEIEAHVLSNINEAKIEIFINGKEIHQKAETTYYIVNYILKNYIKESYNLKLNHYFDLPVGCGYGASGSGAIGTIFGLDRLFNLGLTNQEKGKVAHIAEVVNRTGLGTVCGQLGGGMGMLKEPGFPCTYERIKVPPNLKIICGSFGIIHTKSILTDSVLSLKIKEAGKKALKKLKRDPNVKTFMNASIEFVNETQILEILNLSELKELISDLNGLNIIGASMNQLGRSVYAICRKGSEKGALDVLESYKPEVEIFITSIHQGHQSIKLKNR